MTSDLPLYKKITDDELLAKLRAALESKDLATQFWRSLTDYPIALLREGNSSQAQTLLLHLLHKCQSLAPLDYPKIHKGSPYFWLAISAFLLHDYQTATFFFDATVAEDVNWGADAEKAPTPAMFFIMLEGSQLNPSAQKLAQIAEAKLLRCLDFYKSLTGKPSWLPDCSLPRLRLRFLRPALSKNKPGWRTLAATFISFFIEWEFRNELFDLRPAGGTFEPFYLHLIKGCVLFEGLLKENPKKKAAGGTLEEILQELQPELGIALPSNFTGAFQEILSDLPQAEDRIETAILFAGRVRHAAGHRLSWEEPLSREQYGKLFEMVAAACLYAVACLY